VVATQIEFVFEEGEMVHDKKMLKHVFWSLGPCINRFVSDPNLVQGLSFADVLVLTSRTMLFDTSYRKRRKIVRCFGQGCERYQKGKAKGSFEFSGS